MLACMILCALAFALPARMAAAQDLNATIIVPDAPRGAKFAGCYQISEKLYGPYRMDFCLEQRGSYKVRGGGVSCRGDLYWTANGQNIFIQLRRTSCGNGVAWSADSMTCQGISLFGKKGGTAAKVGEAIARITVPDLPSVGSLRCTYDPSEPREKKMRVTANRVS